MDEFVVNHKASTMNYFINLANKILADEGFDVLDARKILTMVEWLIQDLPDEDYEFLYKISCWK